MNQRRGFRWAALALAGAAFALLVPGSPVYLPSLLPTKGHHFGHATRHWITALQSAEEHERRQAIAALGAIGSDAPEAVPALTALLLEDPSGVTRSQAALALAKMAPASRGAAPALAKALADPEGLVRMNAAMALRSLGADARPAIAALAKAIADEDNQTNLDHFHFTIQQMAAQALGRASAGSSDAVADLATLLQNADTPEIRAAAAYALGDVGTPARAVAPQLRQLLKDSNSAVRLAAEETLQKIGAELPDLAAAKSTGDEFELPEAERAYLWEIEHHGNLLVKHGFSQIAAALKKGDAAALAALMPDSFAGADLRNPQRVRPNPGYVDVERSQDAGHEPVTLSRDALISRLVELRRIFTGAAPQVKFSLMNLGPKIRLQLEGAWVGSALLRIFGEQSPGAPAEVALIIRYEVPKPTQAALSQPGWLRQCGIVNSLIAKAPSYLFTEVAQQRGLNVAKLHDNWGAAKFHPTTGGAFVCDFNRDGILDVLITDVNGPFLYLGKPGGMFDDVTSRFGLPQGPLNNTAAAWVDLDSDGWEDLIVGDRVYRNDGGQRLIDHTQHCKLRLPAGAGNILVADYDNDGKLDLYVTRTGPPGGRSWLDEHSSDPKGNYLFRNKGNWQFEDVTRAAGASGGKRSTFSAAWLDANNDGWPDLHVINEFGDGILLVNQGNGTFAGQPLADRPADYGSMGLAVGDINNDNHIDIFCNNMFSKAGTRVIGNLAPDAFPPNVMEKMRRFVAGSQLHLNKGQSEKGNGIPIKFEQVGTKMQVAGVGWAYGACLADLDNDGWLDIYATAGFISKSRTEPDG